MKSIEVNDVTYACKLHQQDNNLPYLLMLHGFMGDHRAFDHLVDELCDFCNPIALDLLGYGQSSKPTDANRYDEEKQISDICNVLAQLKIDETFLFGYSMGGRLALKIAIENPYHYKGLLLESTTCGISDPQKRGERQQLDARWANEIQNNFNGFLSEWKELNLFQSPAAIDNSLVQKYWQMQSEQFPDALAASLYGFGTGSMTPVCNKLSQIELPVLLLAGSADQKYQRINRYLVNQFLNATFSSIEAGHRTHLDNPSAFISEIQYFLQRF